VGIMQEEVFNSLRARRPQMRQHWETLLRTERASSPLANPEALIFMMDWTLDRVFEALRFTTHRLQGAPARPDCTCGLNPLLVYFATMEQVLIEGLVLTQVELSHRPAHRHEADLAFLKLAIEYIASREIGAFCAVCQHRHAHTGAATASAH
jgi:hypothetical protein